MIFDKRQRLVLAVIREIANLVKPDIAPDERSISAFSFDLALFQAQCLNDPLKEPLRWSLCDSRTSRPSTTVVLEAIASVRVSIRRPLRRDKGKGRRRILHNPEDVWQFTYVGLHMSVQVSNDGV